MALQVEANVRVLRTDALQSLDHCFDCPIESAAVPPKTVANLALRFRPQLPDVRSVENYRVEVGGGMCGTVLVQCLGESVGPRVELSTKNINFYRLELGEKTSQPVEIVNHSDSPQPFQFQCDNQVREIMKHLGRR